MTTVFIIILVLYLVLGICAGCCLLDYSYNSLNYEANKTQDKEKYHKLKTKANWIAVLGSFMFGIPITLGILILMTP